MLEERENNEYDENDDYYIYSRVHFDEINSDILLIKHMKGNPVNKEKPKITNQVNAETTKIILKENYITDKNKNKPKLLLSFKSLLKETQESNSISNNEPSEIRMSKKLEDYELLFELDEVVVAIKFNFYENLLNTSYTTCILQATDFPNLLEKPLIKEISENNNNQNNLITITDNLKNMLNMTSYPPLKDEEYSMNAFSLWTDQLFDNRLALVVILEKKDFQIIDFNTNCNQTDLYNQQLERFINFYKKYNEINKKLITQLLVFDEIIPTCTNFCKNLQYLMKLNEDKSIRDLINEKIIGRHAKDFNSLSILDHIIKKIENTQNEYLYDALIEISKNLIERKTITDSYLQFITEIFNYFNSIHASIDMQVSKIIELFKLSGNKENVVTEININIIKAIEKQCYHTEDKLYLQLSNEKYEVKKNIESCTKNSSNVDFVIISDKMACSKCQPIVVKTAQLLKNLHFNTGENRTSSVSFVFYDDVNKIVKEMYHHYSSDKSNLVNYYKGDKELIKVWLNDYQISSPAKVLLSLPSSLENK